MDHLAQARVHGEETFAVLRKEMFLLHRKKILYIHMVKAQRL